MFTINHVILDGTEMVYSAVKVQYLPPTEENGDSAGVHLLCGPTEAEGDPSVECGHLRAGTVFVMNDKGATVARYYLDRPEAPPLNG